VLEQRLLSCLVLGRIENVDSARDDTDRAAFHRAVVRRAVYAARQPRNDDRIMLPKVVRQSPRETARRGRGVSRTDYGYRLPVEQPNPTPRDEQRWRILKLGQQARIKPLTQRQKTRAKLLDPPDFALGFLPRSQHRRLPTATASKLRHGIQRRGG
jgi:hypothetical protein